MQLQYNIAGVRIGFDANFPLSDSPSWQQFSDHSHAVDYRCFCTIAPSLPSLPSGTNVHAYFDGVKGRYYAITRDGEDKTDIFLTEENLPWGQTVDQLFPQIGMTHILLKKSKLLLHAAYILSDKGAILFAAPSGTGKSTQAELWKKFRGAQIINGDRAVVGLEGKIPTAYGFPLSGSSADCLNRTAPLRAIVSLKQGGENVLRRLYGAEAVSALMNRTALPKEYQYDLQKTVDTTILLAENIPIFEFSCLPEESAVVALDNALLQAENGGFE